MSEGGLYWHWLIVGLVLIGVELLTPGIYLIWLGVAAWVVALVLLGIPGLGWPGQLVTFAAASAVAVLLARQWQRHRPAPDVTLNRRGDSYVGRIFTLDEALADGIGRVRVDDTVWRARAAQPSLPAGAKVRVTGVDGATLIVEPTGTPQS